MRQRIAIALVSAALAALSGGVLSENLMSNGSFETTDERGFPVDWRLSSQPDDESLPGMQGVIDTEIKHEGNQSLKIVAKGVTARYAGLMHTTIELDGPATYRISGWIKAEDYAITPDPQAGDAVHAPWFWVTPKGTEQRLQSASLAVGKAGTFDWTYTENEFKAPCPVTLTAGAWKGFNGTVWYDDFRIEVVSKREPTHTVPVGELYEQGAGGDGFVKGDGFRVAFAPSVRKILRTGATQSDTIPLTERGHVRLARNEYEAIQLVLEATGEDEISVGFLASTLVREDGPDGGVPGAMVTVQPVGYVGYSDGQKLISEAWPDPLLDDTTVRLRPNELQPLWVEVYVPESAPGGKYRTTVTFMRGELESCDVPMDVTVYDFALPAAPTLPTAVASHSASARENLLRHRMGLSYTCLTRPGFSTSPPREREFGEVKPLVDEALAELDSHGWRHFNVEIPRFPGTFMGGANSIGGFQRFRANYSEAQREYIVRYYREYARYLKHQVALDFATVYLYDEPAEEVFDFIRDCRGLIREADGDLRCMVVGHIWPELVGVVDVWCPHIQDFEEEENVALLRERQAAGEKVWAYNTTEEPPYAGWLVDPRCDLLSTRLLFWIVRKYGFDGFLHWACDRNVHPVVQLGDSTDCYLPKGPGAYVLGAGQLVYSEPVSGAELDLDSRPVRMIPSLRLKAIRDGLEDHDYFVLLERAIEEAKVRGVGRELIAEAEKAAEIPAEIARSFTEYTDSAAAVLAWRERVARAIEDLVQE